MPTMQLQTHLHACEGHTVFLCSSQLGGCLASVICSRDARSALLFIGSWARKMLQMQSALQRETAQSGCCLSWPRQNINPQGIRHAATRCLNYRDPPLSALRPLGQRCTAQRLHYISTSFPDQTRTKTRDLSQVPFHTRGTSSRHLFSALFSCRPSSHASRVVRSSQVGPYIQYLINWPPRLAPCSPISGQKPPGREQDA